MSLDADDLLQLALASSLTGHDVECAAVLTRAHEQLARADVPKAAQCAIWLGMSLLNSSQLASPDPTALAVHVTAMPLWNSSSDCGVNRYSTGCRPVR